MFPNFLVKTATNFVTKKKVIDLNIKKGILSRQQKNYGNSNISPFKKT
jgi:hypothetical protein